MRWMSSGYRIYLRGISDQELIDKANEIGRAILTRDSDLSIPIFSLG